VLLTLTNIVHLGNPHGDLLVAYDEPRGQLYVVNTLDENLLILDPFSYQPLHEPIASGHRPNSLALDRHSGHLYICNEMSNSITVIDGTQLDAPVHSLRVGAFPGPIAVDGLTQQLYVAQGAERLIRQIDLTNSSTRFLTVDGPPVSLLIDEVRSRLIVFNSAENQLYIIDEKTGKTVHHAAGGRMLAFDEDNGRLYSTLTKTDTISVLDSDGHNHTFPAGNQPSTLLVDHKHGWLWITSAYDHSIRIIQLSTERLLRTWYPQNQGERYQVGQPVAIGNQMWILSPLHGTALVLENN